MLVGLVTGVALAEVVIRVTGLEQHGTTGVLFEPDPELGWRHIPGGSLRQITSEFAIDWRFNQQGLRRDHEVDLEARLPRILVLGDSQTVGHGVAGDATFAALLEAALQEQSPSARPEVLNAAVDGYSTTQQYLALQRDAASYAPELVVVGVYPGNDLYENQESRGPRVFTRPLLDATLQPRGEATAAALCIPPRALLWDRIKLTLARHSALYVFIGCRVRESRLHDWLARRGIMSPPLPEAIRTAVQACSGCYEQALAGLRVFSESPDRLAVAVNHSAHLLEAMERWCTARGIRFLALLLPTRLEIDADPAPESLAAAQQALGIDAAPRAALQLQREMLRTELERRQVACLDATADLQEAVLASHGTSAMYYRKDWHLTPAGHRVVARLLERSLYARGWLPLAARR